MNILDLVSQRVEESKIKQANSSEYHSPCPMCGGTDRFMIFTDQKGGELCSQYDIIGTWACRKECHKGGDALDLIMAAEHVDFKKACEILRIELDKRKPMRQFRPLTQPKANSSTFTPKTYQEPSQKWQDYASKLVYEANDRLLKNLPILKYLAKRGLNTEAVTNFKLGYIEAESKGKTVIYRARSAFDLPDIVGKEGKKIISIAISRGITIPCFNNNKVVRVRIRKRNIDINTTSDSKYILIPQPAQPYSAPMLLYPDGARPELLPWVVVEAELDAMAVFYACQIAGLHVGVISVLTMMGKPDAQAHSLLQKSPRILVALDYEEDNPEATRKAVNWWRKNYDTVKIHPVPIGKDPGEAFAMGLDLAVWIKSGLPTQATAMTKAIPTISPQTYSGQSELNLQAENFGNLENFSEKSAAAKEKQKPACLIQRWNNMQEMPKEAEYNMDYIKAVVKKNINDLNLLLIPCPRTKPTWFWCYFDNCFKHNRSGELICKGHQHCIVSVYESVIQNVRGKNG